MCRVVSGSVEVEKQGFGGIFKVFIIFLLAAGKFFEELYWENIVKDICLQFVFELLDLYGDS